ncbi:hypothetical protein K458DRAFT_424006 [Lentithecium fluviatile CBS 122367]|uniref:Uncharacterized protein n=1 Tax=Lentithecium fluviatile CBS 122367 TaxID=1168545 RepID=A0A6G1IGX3_9PLEO|nr:hypothetical protein K458DRAFT_424006 [Lentithecium fluviatile CBS 122367]
MIAAQLYCALQRFCGRDCRFTRYEQRRGVKGSGVEAGGVQRYGCCGGSEDDGADSDRRGEAWEGSPFSLFDVNMKPNLTGSGRQETRGSCKLNSSYGRIYIWFSIEFENGEGC